ncbi:unannotated protein [freshwater metagenome]|uniref:Unannotated protein n=1 Tax=freshwater metagenome TaxID=449393 RepID=A0A6J6CE77_9ZZZZ
MIGKKRRFTLHGEAKKPAITASTTSVGMNRKNEITVADSGKTNRGKAEFKINFPPLVIDFAPIVTALVTR